MEKLNIAIGSSVRRKPNILAEFLQGLASLDCGDHELAFRFIDDNDDPASSQLLTSFQDMQTQKGISVRIEQADRQAEILFLNDEKRRAAEMKDALIRLARDERADAILLIDSDVIIHPGTVLCLLSTRKPIVSEIILTRWLPGDSRQPQAWLSEECDDVSQFLAADRTPGIYWIDGPGSCTLIRSEALVSGVSFRQIRSLPLWGDDRHFSIRAECLGFEPHVDTSLPGMHLKGSEDLRRLPAIRAHWRNRSANEGEISPMPRG